MSPNELDERILVAMRAARQFHLSYWYAVLQEHKRHQTFHMHGWPHTLEYGFTCACSGAEMEWRVRIHALKEALPEARESVMRLYRHHMGFRRKIERRAWNKAEHRARSLLHRFLTKEQRLEFRKTKAFTMKDKNGRDYVVTLGSSTNILTTYEGKEYALCVIPNERLPIHDVVLAQKIMLETEPDAFLRLAHVRCKDTNEYFHSGGFLIGDKPVKSVSQVEMLELPEEVLENPREWVEARCRD